MYTRNNQIEKKNCWNDDKRNNKLKLIQKKNELNSDNEVRPDIFTQKRTRKLSSLSSIRNRKKES